MATKPPARDYADIERTYLKVLYAAKAWGYKPPYAGWTREPTIDRLEAEKLIYREYMVAVDPDQLHPLYSLTRKGKSEAYRIMKAVKS